MSWNKRATSLLFLLVVCTILSAGIREDQQFLSAVHHGKIVQVRECLAAGMNADTRNPKTGETALMMAWEIRDIKMMELLITAGARVDQEDGGRLLMGAINSTRPDIAAMLIRHGADINYVDSRYFGSETPLQAAFNRGRKDVALLLIKSGADIHKIKEGSAPLLHRTSDIDLIRALLDAGSDVNETYNGNTALFYALNSVSRTIDRETVDLLLHKGARMDAGDPDQTLLLMYRLCIEGDMPLLRKLYAVGAPVNSLNGKSWTPLIGAARNGSVELVEFLLDRGARVNDVYEYLLANYGENPINLTHPTEILMQESPVTAAIEAGNKEALAVLISRGADANMIYHSGMNALMLVVDDGVHAEEVIRERRRRDMENYTRERNSPSSVAALQAFQEETRGREKPKPPGSAAQATILAKDVVTRISSAQTGESEYDHRYRLQQEQERDRRKQRRHANRIDMMKILIDADIDLNRQDDVFGQTPLIQAIRIGDPRAVKLLLDAGARLDLPDKSGKTPANYASESGNPEILKMIHSDVANALFAAGLRTVPQKLHCKLVI
jgi:serine/threonine-protein phosphatase 6 regulatory ankyrin repeat subunit B